MALPPRVEARNLYGKVSHEASLVSRVGPWDGTPPFDPHRAAPGRGVKAQKNA